MVEWCVGRLQIDADRTRVVEGLSGAVGDLGMSKAELANTLERLSNRWFVMRDVHSKDRTLFMQPTLRDESAARADDAGGD